MSGERDRCLACAAKAPAKINLGLFIGPPRPDGKHELVSVMQSISLSDELTLTPALEGESDELVCPGVQGPIEQNLALRALKRFREATGWKPTIRLTIAKHIPVAAGLGGGSADAAATLRLAAFASGLGDLELLHSLAAELGADVPAQVRPGRWLARGAGELLKPLPVAGSFGVLVLPSDTPLSTAAVYRQLDALDACRTAANVSVLAQELSDALGGGAALPASPSLLHNDLQAPALRLRPEIAASLRQASGAGADFVLLSGSGPTVLGLFAGVGGLESAASALETLQGREPAALAAAPVDDAFGAPESLGSGAGRLVAQQCPRKS